MPARLNVVQNNLSYLGYFEKPPLALWGNGAALVAGLLGALEPHGATLGSVVQDASSAKPVEHAITVELSDNARYRFTFGGLRAEFQNISDEQLGRAPEVVSSVENWLRATVPDVKYSSHLYAYAGHAEALGSSSEEVLRGLSDHQIRALGRSRGAGLTFHADQDDGTTQIQLQLDHSLVVHGGLFIQFIRVGALDLMDHRATAESSRRLLIEALTELNLDLGAE